MIYFQTVQYVLLALFVTAANAGMIENFIKSFTGSLSPHDTDTMYQQELKENQTGRNSSESDTNGQGWARGYASYEPHHQTHHAYYQHNQNMDLYGLLAGLSFASLLGATIIFLATRNNTGGRRRRSVDDATSNLSYISEAIDEPLWEKVQTFKLY